MSISTLDVGATRAPDAAPPSAFARLGNVIVDPRSAFRDIDRSAPWALALLAAIAIRFGSLFAFYRPEVTPLKALTGLLFQLSTIVPLLVATSLLLWIAGVVWRVGAGWSSVFSIVTHVYVAHTLLTIAFASAAGALLPDTVDVELRNPPFTNLSALVADGDSIAHVILGELDVRSAYAALLGWLGMRAASSRASRSSAGLAVGTVWLVRVTAVVLSTLTK